MMLFQKRMVNFEFSFLEYVKKSSIDFPCTFEDVGEMA